MGQKDLSQKKLEDYNDVFADIHNVLVFHEKRMDERYLSRGATESVYKAGAQRLREQRRDTLKEYRDRERYVISAYGIENQGNYDRYMPVRVMGYDYASYRQQIADTTSGSGEKTGAREGQKNQKLYPVITTVLNFSGQRWGKGRSLHGILEIPEGLEEYVADYKIRVIDVAFLPEETIEEFESDFRAVAMFFRNKRLRKQEMTDKTEFKHPEAVLEFLSVFTGDAAYESIKPLIAENKEKGMVINMCWVAQNLIEEGRIEGRTEGIKIGEAKGKTKGILQTLNSLVEDKILGIEDAAERVGMTIEEYVRAVEELSVDVLG